MPKKILLADDSITIQKVVELTFSDGDYEVTAVNNGAKAVQKLAEMRPDIILSDIIMPEKNGYEVCEYVKSHPEFRNIPVVLLTGTFEPFDPDRAEKAGCDAVVTKPFESQSLIHKVEELIAQSLTASNSPAPAPEPIPAPVESASPWMDETPVAAPEPFTHDADIFSAPPTPGATTEMPFESSFASPADTPFGEPTGDAFAGETRAFPRMSFEEMQQMASTPAAPQPEPEPAQWQQPAPVTFDDFAPAAPAAAEPENDSPFGAPPPAEQFSSETRAFPRMSIEELQQMTSGGLSVEPPPVEPPARVVDEPPAAEASPWDEQEAPAFGGETRAFPKLNFDDFQQMNATPEPPPAEPSWSNEPSPFGGEAEAPAFGGETRAFPKLSFDDFQQMSATPEPEPEPQPEPAATWEAPAAPAEDPFAEAATPFATDEPAPTFEEPVAAPEAAWMPPAQEEAPEAPIGFSDQPMPEDMPFSAEPVQEEEPAPIAAEEPSWSASEEPAWSLPEGAAEVAEAQAEPEEPAFVPAETAVVPEAPPMPIAARSDLPSELTDEQVDRIARRVVELISDQVVRNIAWEVIPDLAEMVVKERIRQLEAEA